MPTDSQSKPRRNYPAHSSGPVDSGLDGATGSSPWWIEHADHHMPILMSPEGPFAKSEDKNNAGDPLP